MSNVHIHMVEDAHGDLVDLIYFHHAHAPAEVNGWPASESVDYPVHCGDPARDPSDPWAGCGERIDEVPLTSDGQAEYDRTYRVIRFYFDRPGYRRTIINRCTREEAMRHCNDPETSSSTATSPTARARTRRLGQWFDGFEAR